MKAFLSELFGHLYVSSFQYTNLDKTILLILILLFYGFFSTRIWKDYWKRWNTFMGIVWIIIILLATIISRSNSTSWGISLIPFHTLSKAKYITELYGEVFLNMILFVPLGMTLPFLFDQHSIVKSILIGFTLSLIIELSQYYFHLGYCEMDDLIMNSLGVLVGSSVLYFKHYFNQ